MRKQLKQHPMWVVAMAVGLMAVSGTALAAPGGIMYQGTLADPSGDPTPTGVYLMTFSIWDALSAGNKLWEETGHVAPVTKGAFAVELGLATSFGTIFDGGGARWLEISVNLGSGLLTFAPRVPFTMAPFARKAVKADDADLLDGLDSVAFAPSAHAHSGADITSGRVGNAYLNTGTGNGLDADLLDGSHASAFAGAAHGHNLQDLGGAVTNAQVPDSIHINNADHATSADSATNAVNADTLDSLHATSFWSTLGNTGTNGDVNFIGTTEMVAFEIRANNQRAFRIEPSATSPNLVSGFNGNSVTAGAYGATIGGGGASGSANIVTDIYGVVGGGISNQAGDNAGTQQDRRYATVGGGKQNTASGDASTIAGGDMNQATNGVAAVGGGWNNTAGGYAAVVSGGFNSTASGLYTTVSGGQQNSAGGDHATIGGGWVNQAQAAYSTIAGGGPSDTANPSTTNNKVTDDYGTVGGGCFNQAGNNAGTQQDRRYATVAGGKENTASGDASTIAGGDMNQATNGVAAVGGGWNNTASGYAAVVSGGFNSTASGQYATVSGGQQNSASGDYSFAAGRSANALHNGCFVWVDATGRATNSTAINQFRVRASGGVFFYSSSVNDTSGIQLAAGNSSWSALSDRHQKDNFREVDPAEVLEKVSAMPISTWNYKAQDPKFRHMGPMAQDLYAAFGLGESETAIDTIDADGVALAAIQGLNQRFTQRVAEKEREIAELRAELKDLKAMVRSMAAK